MEEMKWGLRNDKDFPPHENKRDNIEISRLEALLMRQLIILDCHLVWQWRSVAFDRCCDQLLSVKVFCCLNNIP